jgi:DUF1365 family protein
MVYLDLDELPDLLKGSRLLSTHRFTPASFCRSDHAGEPADGLKETILELVRQETGICLNGPVRLLTQLRYWGYYFSPLNLYFCYNGGNDSPEVIVAEVNNTPWGEQHCYVLWSGNRVKQTRAGVNETQYFRHGKSFHVSPFMGMDAEYHWRVAAPDRRLGIHLQSRRGGKPFFDATMQLRRTPFSDKALAASLIRYPFMTMKIIAAIYFEALKLWLKQAPYFPHPRTLSRVSHPSTAQRVFRG